MQQQLKCQLQEGQRVGHGTCGLSGVNTAWTACCRVLWPCRTELTEEGAEAASEMLVGKCSTAQQRTQLPRCQASDSSQQMELQMVNSHRAGSSQRAGNIDAAPWTCTVWSQLSAAAVMRPVKTLAFIGTATACHDS